MQKPRQRGEQFAFKFFAEKRGASAVEVVACVGRGKLADGFDVCRLVYAVQIPARAQFADWAGEGVRSSDRIPHGDAADFAEKLYCRGF